MNKEELALRLNNRPYGDEITQDEDRAARDAGLVVVFGFSDDNMEFAGAIDDELSAHHGQIAYLLQAKDGNWFARSQEELGSLLENPALPMIQANWNTEGFSWTYTTTIPHATFIILENGETYCRGIVFALADLEERPGKVHYVAQLHAGDFSIQAYYVYDTGYPNTAVLLTGDRNDSTGNLITAVHDLAVRRLVGPTAHVDNKSAVKVLLTGQTEPVYLCLYDFQWAITTAIIRRLGKEYLPLL